jgi:hypothetical protein
MRLRRAAAFTAAVMLCAVPGLEARPEHLMQFASDPFSRPELRASCATCHVDPAGGGTRNAFGQAFQRNRYRVTPSLRRQWPDRFLSAISATAPAPVTTGGELKATWAADREGDVVVEIGGEHYLLRRDAGAVQRIEPADALAFTRPPPPPEEPALDFGEMPQPPGATLDYYLVNLPTTAVRLPRSLHVRFTHRFSDPAFRGRDRLGQLFGFDSSSVSSFGLEAGIFRRLSLVAYRAPYPRFAGGPTIELGPVFPLLRQAEGAPLSFSLRTTVEGQQNFTRRYTANVMPVFSRAFHERVELFAAPGFHFWVPHRTLTADFPVTPNEARDQMFSGGLGLSFRFRPQAAVVAEWHPRLAGFRRFEARNVYSFAVQRTTGAHTFALTFSNTQSSTTSRMVTDGLNDLRIGFNLYRRLW